MEIVHGLQLPKARWIRGTNPGPRKTGPHSFSPSINVPATPRSSGPVPEEL
jgi:hypothetical protein